MRLLISIILLIGIGLVQSEDVKTSTVAVGQLFRLDIGEDVEVDTSRLPKWIIYLEGGILEGIPQLANVGNYFIYTNEGEKVAEVQVSEELENGCGENLSSWMEILIGKNISDVPMKEQIETMRSMLTEMKDQLNEKEYVFPTIDEFRLHEFEYLDRYRIIRDTKLEQLQKTNLAELNRHMVLVLTVGCPELVEYTPDFIATILEDIYPFQLVEGVLNLDRVPITTSTRATTSIPHIRTTRQSDNKPIVVNKLSTMICKIGVLCRLDIGENVFNDVEDGGTSNLQLSVHSLDKPSFLVPLNKTTILEGVPLKNGLYTMRLEARDSSNQVATTSFQVRVDESTAASPNHQFSMIIDSPLTKLTSSPANIRELVYRLSSAFAPNQELNSSQLFNVRINGLEENGTTQSTVRWSNVTLSRGFCQLEALKQINSRMVANSNFGTATGTMREVVKKNFVRIMGAQFIVKKVTFTFNSTILFKVVLDLFGKCLNPPTFIVRATTTIRPINNGEPETSPMLFGLSSLLFLLIILVVLLIFFILLLMLYCIQRKGAQKKKFTKGKKIQADYLSKGLPVVFPEEVPHGEDENDQGHVTAPMLVANEQPSAFDKMTLHENPLYKPPPMAQATLLNSPPTHRQTKQSSTSTFAALPTSYNISPPPPRAPPTVTAINQRLPPPYVQAI